ncbi:MAG: Rieske 2Fe-2S domain-containing protein [Chloroflexota bacterium]
MSQEPPRLDDPNFEKLTEHIQTLLEGIESLPFPKVQEDTYELLNCLDLLHREALTRLIELIETKAPEIKLDMANDFAIQTLMMLYNFVPDEELPSPVAENSTYIPLDQIGIAPALKMPVWVPGGNVADLPTHTMRRQIFDGQEVLLCRLDDEIYALQNACLDSVLPLDRGTLDGYELNCPWHDCRYDVRSGEIQNGSGLRLETYPVMVEGERFLVGFNIPEHMR